MAQAKQASKRRIQASKGRSLALPVLGAAGMSLAMASSTSATVPGHNVSSQGPAGPGVALGEEELSDVSLATFYVFDRENDAKPPQDFILAKGGGCGGHGCGGGGGCAHGCGGGGGCGGAHGCGGCARACRGCGCAGGCGCGGGVWIGGCLGCGGGCGSCWVWSPRFGRWVWGC
jgi:hypothetical protein